MPPLFDFFMAALLAALVTGISKIHSPRRKTFVYAFPIPFALAFLVGSKPLSCSHAVGALSVHIFLWSIWGLHKRTGWPVYVIDILMALVYLGGVSAADRSLENNSDFLFYGLITLGITFSIATRWLPNVEEQGHVSPMPVPKKFLLVFIVAASLFSLKNTLGSAVATFPYLGVFTVFECRHSLYTLSKRFGRLSIAFMFLLASLRFFQAHMPMPQALVWAWLPCLATLAILQRGAKEEGERREE